MGESTDAGRNSIDVLLLKENSDPRFKAWVWEGEAPWIVFVKTPVFFCSHPQS